MALVTLGLDGGSFELLDPWVKSGDLPNIERIAAEGIAGDMQSCLPPVTCPNWNCYATGTNPGKLGVFWWEKIDRSSDDIINTSSASQFHGKKFWSYLNGEIGIVNLPTSYPPPSVDGVHIAGGPGSAQTGYTNPESWESKLRTEYDYKVHPERMSLLSKDDTESPCIEEIYEIIDTRFDVLQDLIESGEYEFLHLTIFYINVLQHFYWDDDVVKQAWKQIDRRIGELLPMAELETLVVMSDHGSNKIETEFHINTWLEQNGYLQLSSGKTDILKKLGVTRERIRPILGQAGIEWWARRLTPKRIQNLLPSADGRVKKSGKKGVIDWGASTAVGSGQGPIYVLAKDRETRRKISERLIDELSGLRNDGRLIIEDAIHASEQYHGPYVGEGPDVVLRQAPNVYIDGSIGSDSVFEKPETWRGENKDTGMIMAHGKNIAHGTADEMHILDIAPTILHLMGYSIPEYIDGSVHSEFFPSDSEPAKESATRVDTTTQRSTGSSDEISSQTTERLEDLGYL